METETKIEKIMGKDVLIHNNLKMLALTSASLIVRECEAWIPDGEKANYPNQETVLGDLTLNKNWSQNGFISALQSHVAVVYAVVKYNLEIPTSDLWFVYHEVVLLTNALETYQTWKENVIKSDKEEMGHLTGFGKAVWNDLDEELLAQYK